MVSYMRTLSGSRSCTIRFRLAMVLCNDFCGLLIVWIDVKRTAPPSRMHAFPEPLQIELLPSDLHHLQFSSNFLSFHVFSMRCSDYFEFFLKQCHVRIVSLLYFANYTGHAHKRCIVAPWTWKAWLQLLTIACTWFRLIC